MLHKLKGIVLHTIKHKDNCVILYLYTNKFGRKAYFLRRGKNKNNSLQSLSLIDIDVYGKETASIQYLKEWSPYCSLHNISEDISKSAVALFVGELLYKVLKEEVSNPDLFLFLENSIQLLDKLEDGKANFHIYFLVQLSKYLGFSIPPNRENKKYFDIKKSVFSNNEPLHPLYFNREETEILSAIIQANVAETMKINLRGELRYKFLERMIEFYNFHLDYILPIHSLSVLHEVFSEN